jgi:hypothetical protein
MRLCRALYKTEATPGSLFPLVGYTLAPVAACLEAGQMGIVLMLGLALFLWWEQKRPFLAGAALILPFAKPHLLSLFWFAVVVWSVMRKKRQVLFGFLAALAATTAVALALDPEVFQHYIEMIRLASIGNEFIPALSGVIRLIFFRRTFWVQFVPMAIGLVWSAEFLFRNWSNWNWREHGPPLLVVSVLTTPYAWLADETVLLPAMLQATAFIYEARKILKFGTKIGLVIFALLNLLLLAILRAQVPFSTGIYFWSSLIWFFFYFTARKAKDKVRSAEASHPLRPAIPSCP